MPNGEYLSENQSACISVFSVGAVLFITSMILTYIESIGSV